MANWHVITGEYPPQFGGVSDYSRLVARGLASIGDNVDVWAPRWDVASDQSDGVSLNRLSDHFGPRSLATIGRAMRPDARLLVQYVPHAFGHKAMNVPFCAWLFSQRKKRSIDVMFHEVGFPVRRSQAIRYNFLGLVNRVMAMLVARSASRLFVAIPAWRDMLRPLVADSTPISWLPVPSNIPPIEHPVGVSMVRRRYLRDGGLILGHFGTYGSVVAELLAAVLPSILDSIGSLTILLIGSGSDQFRDRLIHQHLRFAAQLHSTGTLEPNEVGQHLASCDLILQPYPDGVSTRNGSVMASLAAGLPIASTTGRLTEEVWSQSGAVALAPAGDSQSLVRLVQDLLNEYDRRQRLAITAKALYQDRFALQHTIAALRESLGSQGS